MDLYCIDTQLLIWGQQNKASKNEESLRERAIQFFQEIDNNSNIQLLIPSVVLSEFLVDFKKVDHIKWLQIFSQKYIIAPFDAMAASLCAELWQLKHNSKEIKELKEKSKRNVIKADFQIVATAIVHGATCIYSYDDDFKKIANARIEIRILPEKKPEQIKII